MSVQKIISANAYHTYGATVLKGGNVPSTSPVTNAPNKTLLGAAPYLNTLPNSGIAGIDPILANGYFARQNQFIVSKVPTKLANVSNTVMQKVDAGRMNKIHKIESITTRHVASGFRSGLFNIFSGTFTSTIPTTTSSFGNDNAASPTYAIPGELVFIDGNDVPIQKDYTARTN